MRRLVRSYICYHRTSVHIRVQCVTRTVKLNQSGDAISIEEPDTRAPFPWQLYHLSFVWINAEQFIDGSVEATTSMTY